MKSPREAASIFDALDGQHPDADTELHYRNAYELLVATILSAQSTDQRVNMVTPALFERYPTAASLATATPEELEPQIHSTGFFRAKSRSLIGMATALVQQHGGQVPADMDALTQLPGVGRKTANVVLGHALGVPGLPVDRHVLRVANRIGLVESDDPEVVEQELCALLPRERWTRASDVLILHGRRVCRPKPQCDVCSIQEFCVYYQTGAAGDDRQREQPTGVKKAARVSRSTATSSRVVKKPAKPNAAGTRRTGAASKAKGGGRTAQRRKRST